MNTFVRAVLPALVAAGLVFSFVFFRRSPAPPPKPPPPPSAAPIETGVLYGRNETFEVLLRRRYAAPVRAAFADRALIESLGGRAEETPPVFVELLVRRTGSGAIPPELSVRLRSAAGAAFAPRPLSDYLAAGATPQARMLVAAFSPPADLPFGNGSVRRVVYGLPPGLAFEDLVSGEAARVTLAPVRGNSLRLDAVLDDVGAPFSDRLPPGSATTVAEAAASAPGGPESRR